MRVSGFTREWLEAMHSRVKQSYGSNDGLEGCKHSWIGGRLFRVGSEIISLLQMKLVGN